MYEKMLLPSTPDALRGAWRRRSRWKRPSQCSSAVPPLYHPNRSPPPAPCPWAPMLQEGLGCVSANIGLRKPDHVVWIDQSNTSMCTPLDQFSIDKSQGQSVSCVNIFLPCLNSTACRRPKSCHFSPRSHPAPARRRARSRALRLVQEGKNRSMSQLKIINNRMTKGSGKADGHTRPSHESTLTHTTTNRRALVAAPPSPCPARP